MHIGMGQCMAGRTRLGLTLALRLLSLASAALMPHSVLANCMELQGSLTQGGLVWGKVPPGSRVSLNGAALDAHPRELKDHDVIELAGVKMEFFLKG